MKSCLRAACLVLFAFLVTASEAEPDRCNQGGPVSPTTVFVNVNVIPMDREVVLPRQSVVVRQGRIEKIGPSALICPPIDSVVIDGEGQYLMPGLTDTHVHLEGRENFGDAPLFLASGITTVFNLRGRPEILQWKKEIKAGTLLAPNLYSSGEFINEPRERTPEEVEDEVRRQKEQGYDIIKFHEIVENGQYLTTTGQPTTECSALPAELAFP